MSCPMNLYTNSDLYEKSYEEALKHNETVRLKIENFIKELEDVQSSLELHQKHLYQNVMIPMWNKALIRGKLVHTNEILVNIGENWFIKTSANRAIEMCKRMIGRCNTNLKEYEKEMELLSSNLDVPQGYEIFPRNDIKEIIEPYDEETEIKWREKHKQHVKEYRKQLSEAHKTVKLEDSVEKFNLDYEEITDEKQENKYNEAVKLSHPNPNSVSYVPSVKVNQSNENEDVNNDVILSVNQENSLQEKSTALTKTVTFAENTESISIGNFTNIENTDDINIIYFKHSENKSLPVKSSTSIYSPSDLFLNFLRTRKKHLKPILKSESAYLHKDFPNQNKQLSQTWKENLAKSVDNVPVIDCINTDEISIVGEIIEKSPEIFHKMDGNVRPLSKFKKARIARNKVL